MPKRLCLLPWSRQGWYVTTLFLTIVLTSCVDKKSEHSLVNSALSATQSVSAQTGSSTLAHAPRHIVLPNPALIGCKTGNCTQLLPDEIAEPDAIHPWQVSVDFSGQAVIGSTVLYDQPVTIEDIQAAVDKRYGRWAVPTFRTGPMRAWRIEPEKFIIQLSTNDDGMVQLIYLVFDPKYPVSEAVRKKILDRFDATHPDPFARKMLLDSMTPQPR